MLHKVADDTRTFCVNKTVSSKIPVIDFAPFREGDTSRRSTISAEIYHACHEIGFMYLKNPGIAPDLIARTMMHSQQFFNLPLSEKNKLAWSDEFSNHGYVGVGRERLNDSKPGDLKEAYNIGSEINQSNPNQLKAGASLSYNRWLEADQCFLMTMLDFFSACNAAAMNLCEAMAIALGLSESFFKDKHARQENTLRLLHYPPIEQTPSPGQLRAGEHSDYGSFTLLFQYRGWDGRKKRLNTEIAWLFGLEEFLHGVWWSKIHGSSSVALGRLY